MDCVRNEKHFSVTKYKAEVESSKKERKEGTRAWRALQAPVRPWGPTPNKMAPL